MVSTGAISKFVPGSYSFSGSFGSGFGFGSLFSAGFVPIEAFAGLHLLQSATTFPFSLAHSALVISFLHSPLMQQETLFSILVFWLFPVYLGP